MGKKIEQLIALGQTSHGIATAREAAKKALPEFPHNGCATFVSCLLREAGIDVPILVGAEELAHHLEHVRGWVRHSVGNQIAGDVAVTKDENDNGRADHIFVVLEPRGADLMLIADNQSTQPHVRYASGHGKTPVDYLLRGDG